MWALKIDKKTESPPQGNEDRSAVARAGYLETNGRHIYTFLHGTRKPVCRVLLAGPFASERFSSYIPWIRWARHLASRNIEVLRFDYGGVGESTGNFEDMGFYSWSEDVAFLVRWLEAQEPRLPVILHGLEMGALMAGKAFASGLGDALLMWSVPKSANDLLRRVLWRQMFMRFSERSSFSDHIQALESGNSLEVDGYVWSGRLWRESLAFGPLPEFAAHGKCSARESRVRTLKLQDEGAAVFARASMGRYVTLNPDLSPLFAQNVEWILRVSEGL